VTETQPEPRRGSLVAVGAGIRAGLHLTEETRRAIARADDVLYLLAELAPTSWIHALHPAAESLSGLYRPGRDQADVYEELVESALERVRKGRRVCMVTYGNPAVFDDACHEAVRRARREGFDARLLPAVSAIDCLFTDLEIDPGKDGLQLFDAARFLEAGRAPDTRVPLVLWQISVIGRTRTTDEVAREGLQRLAERLTELYGADHGAVVYEAAPFPVGRATIDRTTVGALADAPVSGLSSLYVPPA
jgi:precorrin-6B methylase 1